MSATTAGRVARWQNPAGKQRGYELAAPGQRRSIDAVEVDRADAGTPGLRHWTSSSGGRGLPLH
jgi:hypothetical protein